jgi:hypothetical protein
MDYKQLKTKSIALLIWNTEKENDAHVYIGEIIKEEACFHFINKSKGWRVSLDDEKMERLKEVTEDMKEIFLGADYFISLSIAALPNDDNQGFIPTGIKWH